MGSEMSLYENLLCSPESPFVIRRYSAHLDRKGESILLKKKRLTFILWPAFLKEKFSRGHFASSFLYFMQFHVAQEKSIPDTNQHFFAAVLLPHECCLLKHGKSVNAVQKDIFT